jgi:hypothetical protein
MISFKETHFPPGPYPDRCTEDYAHPKPAPDPYRTALHGFGAATQEWRLRIPCAGCVRPWPHAALVW